MCVCVPVSEHRLHLSSTTLIPWYTWASGLQGFLADCMCQTLNNYTDCCPRNFAPFPSGELKANKIKEKEKNNMHRKA